MAWHVALLSRAEGRDFPTLEAAMGEAPAERFEPTPEDQLHALRMWNAVTKGR